MDPQEVTVRAVRVGPYEGLPDTLPAGEVKFNFEQDGDPRTTHDLRIEELDAGTRKLAGTPQGCSASRSGENRVSVVTRDATATGCVLLWGHWRPRSC